MEKWIGKGDIVHRGEWVKSNCLNRYYGIPGRVVGIAQSQYGEWTRFKVELITGELVVLEAILLTRIDKPEDTDSAARTF